MEAACVSPAGRLASTQIGIFNDDQIDGLRQLADTIKADGALAGIQIHHAGEKSSVEKNWGLEPVTVPKMSEQEILSIIKDFADASERAFSAGYDIIEIHGAHGYLGSQFLSTRFNKRKDDWGGSLENRMRFLCEVVKAVQDRLQRLARQVNSPKPIVACRLGVAGVQLPIQEGIETARHLIRAGLELLDVSNAGSMPREESIGPIADTADGFSPLFDLAFRTRKELHADPEYRIPVIGVGGIKTPRQAFDVLNRKDPVDFVAAGRAVLADPQWFLKSVSGMEEKISYCLDCSPCFHFKQPELCPARRKLDKNKEQYAI
ncbi:NADH:flavin oxidoreductase [Spirochaeta dissipatitropha]